MKTMLVACGAAIVVALAVSACGDDKKSEPAPTPTPTPMATDGGNGAAGVTAYTTNCASCHGADAQGMGSYPELKGLSDTEAEFKGVVRNGKGTMPKFTESQVSDAEISAIYAWLKK